MKLKILFDDGEQLELEGNNLELESFFESSGRKVTEVVSIHAIHAIDTAHPSQSIDNQNADH